MRAFGYIEIQKRAENGPYLIVSGHDFRTENKANIHFIAREFARRATTRVFSLGYSLFSKIKNDPRAALWDRANAEERVEDVDCFLWRTLVHPVRLRPGLDTIAAPLFRV